MLILQNLLRTTNPEIFSSIGQSLLKISFLKKDISENVQKTVFWNANYDRENDDYTNALRPRRFKWCDVSTNFT